jgi:hypothetical protein
LEKGRGRDFSKESPFAGGDPAQIQVVCCDMRDPYLNGIGKFMKNALVVFDRFHYPKARVMKGTVEGLNSKIKTAMKRDYSFKQVVYHRTIVYLVAGRLSFSYPL